MKYYLTGLIVSAVVVAAMANTPSPYAGQEIREIKALSQQEIDDYLNGRGSGYARAAELNHFPGPAHVLDLADELGLTREQREQSRAIFETMKVRAVALGKQLVDKEIELDRRFSDGSVNAELLHELVSGIGMLQAEIRYVHLAAHLEQKALLAQHQVHLYDKLRGYGATHDKGQAHSH